MDCGRILPRIAHELPCLTPCAFRHVNWSSTANRFPSRRPEVNETRFFASIPPYLDIAIIFNTFVWAGMVRHSCPRACDGLDLCGDSWWHSKRIMGELHDRSLQHILLYPECGKLHRGSGLCSKQHRRESSDRL